jgi:hypothetical protein
MPPACGETDDADDDGDTTLDADMEAVGVVVVVVADADAETDEAADEAAAAGDMAAAAAAAASAADGDAAGPEEGAVAAAAAAAAATEAAAGGVAILAPPSASFSANSTRDTNGCRAVVASVAAAISSGLDVQTRRCCGCCELSLSRTMRRTSVVTRLMNDGAIVSDISSCPGNAAISINHQSLHSTKTPRVAPRKQHGMRTWHT